MKCSKIWISTRLVAITACLAFAQTNFAAEPAAAKDQAVAATAPAAALPADDGSLPLELQDASFDRYVDLNRLSDAVQAVKADLVLDIALQLAEGERVLLRRHKVVASDQVFLIALNLAVETRDTETLARLGRAAKLMNNNALAAQVASSEKLTAASRSVEVTPSLPVESTSLEVFAMYKATVTAVTAAKASRDRESLKEIEATLEKSDIYSAREKQILKKFVADALSATPETKDNQLAKLMSASRQWQPWPRPWPQPQPRPQFPIWQSPRQVTNINPWTGGVDTAGTTVNNTVFDPWRNRSRNNGTQRQVNRPVYDNFGNIRGWERGVEWTNSVTGQTHFEKQVITPNVWGGVNREQAVGYAAPPPTTNQQQGFDPEGGQQPQAPDNNDAP